MMRHDEPATMMHLIRPLLLLIGVLLLLAVADHAAGDSVRIHDVSGSDGPDIVLAQVAELGGDYANEYADVVVGRFEDEAASVEIEISVILQAMRDQGAKLGLLDFQGFGLCTVHRTFSEPGVIESEQQEAALANVDVRSGADPVTIYTPTTVRALIEQTIVERIGVDDGSLEITFSERDEELLRASAVAGRYEIEPVVEPTLGRLSFKVYAFQGTQRVGSSRVVTVDVGQRVIAVIAGESIARDTLINRRQVRLREVLIKDALQAYLTDTALVTGQVASKNLTPGDLITASEVKLPVAVRRRDRVSVQLQSRGVKITFNGIAQDAGSVGDTIEVENVQTKERFVATVVGRGQVVAGEKVPENKEETE